MYMFTLFFYFFFFNDTATTEIYTLSLHDALPISGALQISEASCGDPPRPGGHPNPAFPIWIDCRPHYRSIAAVHEAARAVGQLERDNQAPGQIVHLPLPPMAPHRLYSSHRVQCRHRSVPRPAVG